jgi:hypothetical protein
MMSPRPGRQVPGVFALLGLVWLRFRRPISPVSHQSSGDVLQCAKAARLSQLCIPPAERHPPALRTRALTPSLADSLPSTGHAHSMDCRVARGPAHKACRRWLHRPSRPRALPITNAVETGDAATVLSLSRRHQIASALLTGGGCAVWRCLVSSCCAARPPKPLLSSASTASLPPRPGSALLQQGQALAAAPQAQPFALPLSGPSVDLEALLEPGALVRNPGVGWAFNNRQRQLFYPPWMAGTWQVRCRLQPCRPALRRPLSPGAHLGRPGRPCPRPGRSRRASGRPASRWASASCRAPRRGPPRRP